MAGMLQALRGQQPIPGSLGAPAPGVNVAPTDVTGPIMAKYQAEMAKYMAEQQRQNAIMGGLFGLGGSALGGWMMGGAKLPSWLK